MSSVQSAKFWQSTSLRWSIVLTLVLWMLTLSVAIGVADRTEQALLAGPVAAVEQLEVEFLDVLQSDRFFSPELVGEAFTGQRFPLIARDDDGFLTFLKRYVAQLRKFRTDAAPRLAAELDGRLWLLGESPTLELEDEPPEPIVELMASEVPERFHDALFVAIAERLEQWPAVGSWTELPEHTRARLVLERWQAEREALTESLCFALIDGSGTVTASNLEVIEEAAAERAGFEAYRVRLLSQPRSSEDYCWGRRVALEPTGTVFLGERVTPTFRAVLQVRDQLGGGLLLTFLVSLLVGGFLGFRIHRRLRNLNAAVADVRAGHFERRLSVRADGDDFDRLGHNINGMLDQLNRSMDGIRAVSDNIAHDLKTPLTRLRHQIDFLAQQPVPDASSVQAVADEADRLLETLNALLRIAQLEQGGRLQTVRFDLDVLVRELGELYEPVFAEQGIEFRLLAEEHPVWVDGDRALWLQALSNLIENALTHGGGQSPVVLRLASSAGQTIVEVQDAGPGIPEHEFERVFERFYRSDRARSRPGTGLGLSLVRAVADTHGVVIALENSKEPPAGLSVRLSWPPQNPA
ncbi:MAG: HAMP domain-containing sensor histidine kinase [Pseudomonadota bacterium]